jgi:folate-dependent tRNA-U54 methylase TrmFO/GidA
MNINFGLFPSLEERARGREKNLLMGKRAWKELEEWKERSRI